VNEPYIHLIYSPALLPYELWRRNSLCAEFCCNVFPVVLVPFSKYERGVYGDSNCPPSPPLWFRISNQVECIVLQLCQIVVHLFSIVLTPSQDIRGVSFIDKSHPHCKFQGKNCVNQFCFNCTSIILDTLQRLLKCILQTKMNSKLHSTCTSLSRKYARMYSGRVILIILYWKIRNEFLLNAARDLC